MSALDPRQRDLVKCEDMRIWAERARTFLASRSLEEFRADPMLQAAVVRCVEVIGEAARLVSEDTRRRATCRAAAPQSCFPRPSKSGCIRAWRVCRTMRLCSRISAD